MIQIPRVPNWTDIHRELLEVSETKFAKTIFKYGSVFTLFIYIFKLVVT